MSPICENKLLIDIIIGLSNKIVTLNLDFLYLGLTKNPFLLTMQFATNTSLQLGDSSKTHNPPPTITQS
jgi:hypothetical protein